MWKFKGCFESISRVFQKTFEGVSGVFLRVFEATSKECVKEVIEVYGNFEGVLGKFNGCHREISTVFQECFTGDSSLLSRFQGEFQEVFKDLLS